MGYEVRMIIGETGSIVDDDGAVWVSPQADFRLGKIPYDGAYHALLERTKMDAAPRHRYYFYAKDTQHDEASFRVLEDRYGDDLVRLAPEDVIEAIDAELKDYSNYTELRAARAALAAYVESSRKDLIVLHYGY